MKESLRFYKICSLQLVAAGERAVKRRLIGVLEAAAHGQAVGQTGDFDAQRLAYGLPVGGNLEYTDENTLYKALEGRGEL